METTSLYTSEHGKQAILALYEEKLASLGIAYAYRAIATRFGATNIITAGVATKPPLFLFHGSNGCAPVALETYKELLDQFSVYAIDVLAQPNKSAETRLSMKENAYGLWVHDLIDALGLQEVTMAGFSFGGLVILKALEQDERKIKAVFLSAPAYIVNGNPIKALFRFFLPMKRYMKTKKEKYLHRFLDAAFTDKDAFAQQFLGLVFSHFRMDFTPVPVIATKAARRIKTPITIVAAADDIIFPGPQLLKRAQKIFPSLQRTLLLQDAKHVQSTAQNARIAALILDTLPA